MSTKIKPKFSFKLLSVLLAVLMVISSFPVAVGSAFAGSNDDEKITLSFKVTDSAEQPVEGAKIKVTDKDKKDEVLTQHKKLLVTVDTYETDKNGEVSFEVKSVNVGYSYTVTADDMFDKDGTFLKPVASGDGSVEPVKVSMEYKITCEECNGTGQAFKKCGDCFGTGKTSEICPTCNGENSENCETCNGTGKIISEENCEKCEGTGKSSETEECSNCGGSGETAAKDFDFKFNDISVPFNGTAKAELSKPIDSQGEITYSSNNENITVEPNTGKVTTTKDANIGDTATITAVIAFDKGNGFKAKKTEFTVTVVPNDEDSIENYIDKYDDLTYNGESQEYIKAKIEGEHIPVDLKCQYYKVEVIEEIKEEIKINIEDVKNAGDYSVEVSDKNHPDPVKLYFTIEKAPLTIIPDEGQSKEYGEDYTIKYQYSADGIDFGNEGIDKSKHPIFKGKLSYKYNSDYPDVAGEHDIINDINDELRLDASKAINNNYKIVKFTEGVKIKVKDITSIKELVSLPESYNGWYNKAYFDNNDKKLTIDAPEGFKISTTGECSSYDSNVSFSDEQDKETVTLYLKNSNYSSDTETDYKRQYYKTEVEFGIDTTPPILSEVNFDHDNDSKLASIGRLLTFDNFFNEKITATVTAEDEKKDKDGKIISSGIDEDSYKMWLGTQVIEKAEVEGESNKTVNNVIRNFTSNNNVLTLEENKFTLKGNVFVSVKDKAGNELDGATKIYENSDMTGVMVTSSNSNISDTGFMIEKNNPYLEGSTEKDKNAGIKVEGKGVCQSRDVYSGDVTFKFTAEDDDSGLYNVDIRAYTNKNSEGTNIPYTDVIDNEKHKLGIDGEQTYSESFSVNTKYITERLGQAATYTIVVTVSDNAGNVSETYIKKIHIDRQSPVVTKFEITNTAGGTSDGDTAPHDVRETSYGFYFKESAEVKVTFEDFKTDDNWASGVAKAKIYLQDKNGAIYQVTKNSNGNTVLTTANSSDKVTEIDFGDKISNETTVTFTVAQDFKGQIYAMAYDAVENCPTNSSVPLAYNTDDMFTKDGYQKPNGDIIETLEKHNASYAINFNAPETKNKDKDGTPLYSDLDNKGVNLDLTVSDTYSGIKSISVEVSAPYDTDENFKHKVTVGKNAKDSGALTYDNSGTRENDWVITDTDENLATEMKNTINITNNSNDIEVKVTLVDRASHESTKSYKLSIDKTKPEIEITYKNNDVQNGKYYQDDRTATVTVRELNLSTPAQFDITAICDKTDIKPSEQALAELIKKTYDKKNFEKFHKEAGEDGKKTEYYEFIFEIPAKTQGDYEITASVTDNAGNKSDYNRVDKFSVDTTDPFITVTFDNNQSKNGNYFATKRTATITVTDRYFDATQSPIVIASADNGKKFTAPSPSGWSKQNSKYEQSCTVDFSKDGKYSFTVDTTDLSGKDTSQYKVSDFIIDNTDPTIKLYINNEEVKDGENRAYIDEVIPKVVVEDTNFSQTDTKVTITPVVAKDETNFGYESSVISKNAKNENGMTYVFNNFSGEDGKERKYDNIYNLDVSTTDMSGHTTKAQRITFSVNRYGSVYICEPNKYYAEKPVIQVEEVNVNPINFKSKETYINVISSSGKTQTLKSKDLVIQKQEASDKNWYSYLYAIPSSCFDIDDVYSIKVSSKDKAKRVSTNINDANKKDITFTVDTTNPYFEVTNYIENENIKADSKELEIALMDDTSGIASYSISFDGQPIENVDTKIYENKINFKFNVKGATALNDAKGRQLEVKITDAAGRTNTMSDKDKSTYNIRISSNVFVEALATMQDFYRNTVAFWCTVAGIIAAIGIVIWIILARKKKKSDENE